MAECVAQWAMNTAIPSSNPMLVDVFSFFHVFNMATSEINMRDCQNNTHSLK